MLVPLGPRVVESQEGKYMPARLARFCPGVTLCAMAAYTVRVYFCACMRVASVNLQGSGTLTALEAAAPALGVKGR